MFPPKFMLNFNPYCELLRGWEVYLTIVFRGGTFGRKLRLNEARRMGP
jgi:hypothetical protein